MIENMDTSQLDKVNHLNLQQLHTFCRVIECGGYAAAAKVMDLSVPSVWQHIQAIEKVYKVKLFERAGRGVQPTEAAHRLYEAATEIFVQVESTFQVVQAPSSDEPIRLVTGVRMMIEDLAKPLAIFRRSFQNRLVIHHGNNCRAEQLLLSDEADLALTLEPGLEQESPLLRYEPAYAIDFLAVAKKNHPFAKANSSALRELVKHDLIVTVPGTYGREALALALHRENLRAEIAIETDNSGFTLACAQAGMGVGILAGNPHGVLLGKLTTRSLRKELGHRQIVFMWKKRRLLSEPMLALIEEVKRSGGASP